VNALPTVPFAVVGLVIVGVLVLVNVQFRISWVAVEPPVPPVKPTKAVFPPTILGMSTTQLVANLAFVVVSVMDMVNVVPS